MKNIIILGPINQKTSLGIYARILTEKFLATKKYKIIDLQRDLTGHSLIYCIWKGILGSILTTFPGKYTKDDVILIPHSAHTLPPLLLGTKAKKIHVVHDFFYYNKTFYENLGWFYKTILYPFYYLKIHKFLYKIALKRADHIIAISNATKNEILEKMGNAFESKISVIYNGVEHSVFNTEQQKVSIHSKNTSIPSNKKYILYIGSELKRKNLKNIIAGFALFLKNHPEYIFIKAPNGGDIYRQQTLEYIQDNNLQINKNFFFLDTYLSTQELVSLYQNAEVFVFPSLQEGFGLPILEAQACGTPVITSNREPMNELVPYKNFTVNPHSPQDIAEKIEQITQNPDIYMRLKNEGLEFCKNFSWDNTAAQFIEIFENKN